MQSAEEIARRLAAAPPETFSVEAAVKAFAHVRSHKDNMKLNELHQNIQTRLSDLVESDRIKSQEEMIDLFKKEKVKDFYKKRGTFKARKGKPGEHVETVIDGEVETTKTVKENEVVIEGPKGELYVVSEKKFNERYEVDKELSDTPKPYKSKGFIRAFEWKGEPIKFIASWEEEMICKDGDFLAAPVKSEEDNNVTEVYRVERSVFDETYKEQGNE